MKALSNIPAGLAIRKVIATVEGVTGDLNAADLGKALDSAGFSALDKP